MNELAALLTDLSTIKPALQLTFYVLVGVYAVFSAVLYYHWDTYATVESVSRVTLLAYVICTLPLVGIMGVILLVL
jgi:hypothetical protein